MSQEKRKEGFKLVVPLNASRVEDFLPEQDVKVVVLGQEDVSDAGVVSLDKKGHGTAAFTFDAHPGRLHIVVGPADANDEELADLPTINVHVSIKEWHGKEELTLPGVLISEYYWRLWLRRCRKYVIHGRVVCEDGSPVPGAKVSAFDVDRFPGPYAVQLLGSAYTDIHGGFKIHFVFCCRRWSKKWLKDRVWRYDPRLRQRVEEVLKQDPDLQFAPQTSSRPDLSLFSELLEGEDVRSDEPLYAIDPTKLESVRKRLLKKLPAAPDLETLGIWPWGVRCGWWDCRPDVIFKVTQDALEPGRVLLDEGVGDTRWNISTQLDEVLVIDKANDPLCYDPCPDPPGIDGECLVFSHVSGRPVIDIGGNRSNMGTPEGFYLPGNVAPCNSHWDSGWDGDRPFARIAAVEKKCGDMLNVDYYEIEMKDGSRWVSPTPAALLDFKRRWMDMGTSGCPTGDVTFRWVDKCDTSGAIHHVVESREHFEEGGTYQDWWPAGDRIWIVNKFLLVPIDGMALINGTYQFRVVGWKITANDLLTDYRVLPDCIDGTDNNLVLAFHSRVFDQAPHKPINCGTVLWPTREPYTHIDRVLVDGVALDPGEAINTRVGKELTIEFEASDVAGHLGYYRLTVVPEVGQPYSLLNRPRSDVTAIVDGTPTGWRKNDPNRWFGMYGTALCPEEDQGAVAPNWYGGRYRLRVPLDEAFPNPGSHELQLWAWKRTVVGVTDTIRYRGDYNYYNNSIITLWVSA